MINKILNKAVLFALVAQLAFIMCMNLFRADTIIDFDSSSAYLHEIEMGSQCKIFPAEYSYQASMDLDSAAFISAFLYHFIGNIFLSRGIANNLVVLLYIYIITCILSNIEMSLRLKRFCILLFLIPYSMMMLGYWRMLFTGGGFYAIRALVPLLIISIVLDMDKGKDIRKYLGRMVLLLFIVFLTGLSSGAYVLMCAVFPLILWEVVRAFMHGDFRQLKSKRFVLGLALLFAAAVGLIAQKAVGFSSAADIKYILNSKKWVDAVLSSFAGLFELFGGLTVHEQVKLFSVEAIGTAVGYAVTWILILAIVYTALTCIKKKEISNMHGYIFSLMLVNVFMFSFLDLKYGSSVYESRYHLIPMLPSFFMLVMMIEDFSKSVRLNQLQVSTIHLLITGLFAASMLYGDAQWVYLKTANECDKLVALNGIMEKEGIKTAVVAGLDNKGLGRKLRVYTRDINYLVVNEGAESAFRTTFGGTTRYLDNAMQQGKTAVIATPEAYKTLPNYLINDMQYLMDYDGLQIYVADKSRFDYVSGIVAEKNRVIDFPYSPDYIYENAYLDDDGVLVIKTGGGILKNSYASVSGIWNYSVYYDLSASAEDAYMEIQTGKNALVRTKLNPAVGVTSTDDIVMTDGDTVHFLIAAPAGAKIKRIEITRRM